MCLCINTLIQVPQILCSKLKMLCSHFYAGVGSFVAVETTTQVRFLMPFMNGGGTILHFMQLA